MKKIICFILILTLLPSLTSCSIVKRLYTSHRGREIVLETVFDIFDAIKTKDTLAICSKFSKHAKETIELEELAETFVNSIKGEIVSTPTEEDLGGIVYSEFKRSGGYTETADTCLYFSTEERDYRIDFCIYLICESDTFEEGLSSIYLIEYEKETKIKKGNNGEWKEGINIIID